jgi:hypothetical protein
LIGSYVEFRTKTLPFIGEFLSQKARRVWLTRYARFQGKKKACDKARSGKIRLMIAEPLGKKRSTQTTQLRAACCGGEA